MTITEARFKMSDGTEALFVAEAADMPALPPWPFLAISVKDLEEAQELLDTLERSRARKRSGKEAEPEASKPGPGPLPPKCIAPGCANEGTVGPDSDLCDEHGMVPETTANEWRHARAKEQGRKRAKSIREGVEGEPGKVVAS